MDYRSEASDLIKDFLGYHEVIKDHSKKTVDEYFLDLRTFFRFLKIQRGLVPEETDFADISVRDVDIDFVGKITKQEVYDYLSFLSRDRIRQQRSRLPEYGLSANTRARKLATIRSLFRYLTVKTGKLSENPIEALDSPKIRSTLPKYLTVDQCKTLLSSVSGINSTRDYCILVLFLNCALRISELCSLNLSDIGSDRIRVLGKGNKERVVFLNDTSVSALNAYLRKRAIKADKKQPALFLSTRGERISRSTVHNLVKKHMLKAGLDSDGFSAHKLRHTAATMMLGNGVDLKTLQELLGHEHLNTTEIYTHIENTDLKIAADANPLAHFTPGEKK